MSSDVGFLIFVLVFAGLWFVLTLPARKQQRRTRELQASLEAGDPVVTTSGIFGTVHAVHDDGRIEIEISPGVVVVVARQAIGARQPVFGDAEDRLAEGQVPEEPTTDDPAADKEN